VTRSYLKNRLCVCHWHTGSVPWSASNVVPLAVNDALALAAALAATASALDRRHSAATGSVYFKLILNTAPLALPVCDTVCLMPGPLRLAVPLQLEVSSLRQAQAPLALAPLGTDSEVLFRLRSCSDSFILDKYACCV
jgi:hypothetical protein